MKTLSGGVTAPIGFRAAGVYSGIKKKKKQQLDLALLEAFGEEPGQFVRRGLLKMIDDCCEWSVESAHAPDEVRTAVFK